MESTTTGLVAQSPTREDTMLSLIAERERTGVSVKHFCKSHQLSEASYYHWLRKLRKKVKAESSDPPAFTILNLNADAAGSLFCEVIAPGGSMIRFYQPVPVAFLQSLL